MTERRTEYPAPVLEDVQAEAREAESLLREALAKLERQTLEDAGRADWENVPALDADDGHETSSDAQLRVAINDARDALAEVDDLVSILLDGSKDPEDASE